MQNAKEALGLQQLPQRRSTVDEVYESLAESIFDRVLEPGSRLTIDALTTAFGRSTTPVREALMRAAAQRLVVQDINRGFTVTPLLTEAEYHQLFYARLVVESAALETGVFSATAVARLGELAALMETLGHGARYRDFRDFSRADREFHRTLVGMSPNAFLIDAWNTLHFHLHVGRLYAGSGVVDFGWAMREHKLIVAAARAGDRARLSAAAVEHVRSAEQRLVALVPGGSADALRTNS